MDATLIWRDGVGADYLSSCHSLPDKHINLIILLLFLFCARAARTGSLNRAERLGEQRVKLRLLWIPGHGGNPGNDAADSLAKQAISPEETHKFRHLVSAQKRDNREKMLKEWQEEWQACSGHSASGQVKAAAVQVGNLNSNEQKKILLPTISFSSSASIFRFQAPSP